MLLLALALGMGSFLAQAEDAAPAAETPLPAPTYVGADTCMGCHDDQARGYTRTMHARVDWTAPAATESPAPEGKQDTSGQSAVPGGFVQASDDSAPAAEEATPQAEETPAAEGAPATEETAADEEPAPTLPEGVMGCEACHGPGSNHVEAGGGETGIINPAKQTPMLASGACLKCHESHAGQAEWRFSMHARSGVACYECHKVHPKDKKDVFPGMLAKNEPDACYGCHAEQKAQSNWPSHHPIRERRILCSDCHNVHGAGITAFKGAPSSRELCLSCHAQYRGPFVVQHSPVAEDCTQCHRPHGSAEDNLLVASVPSLCLRCHTTAHNPHTLASTMSNAQVAATTLQFSRCDTCHMQVHGSDFGPRLTR